MFEISYRRTFGWIFFFFFFWRIDAVGKYVQLLRNKICFCQSKMYYEVILSVTHSCHLLQLAVQMIVSVPVAKVSEARCCIQKLSLIHDSGEEAVSAMLMSGNKVFHSRRLLALKNRTACPLPLVVKIIYHRTSAAGNRTVSAGTVCGNLQQ